VLEQKGGAPPLEGRKRRIRLVRGGRLDVEVCDDDVVEEVLNPGRVDRG
jgi:hypothetical protein